MNSLVVFFSVLAMAAAKPSGALLGNGLLAYSAPINAISHATLLDIQAEPAVIAGPTIQPIVRNIIAEPTIVAAPAAVSHQSRVDIKSEPAILKTAAIAPIAHTVIAEPSIAVAALNAPAAVSHQSRIDIKSSPGIIETIATAPIANSEPIAYGASIATAALAPTLIKTGAITPAIIKTATITGPGVIAAPAAIAAPVVPLDTPEVAAARAAHLQAKAEALARAHSIHKRSASLIAPAVPLIKAPLTYAAPIGHIAHITYSTPFIAKTYSVHPW